MVLDKVVDVFPFLEAAFIPMEHRLHLFFQKAELLFWRIMRLLLPPAAGMAEL